MFLTLNHQKRNIYQVSQTLPAESASREWEAERKRYYEGASGPVVEIDATLDIAGKLEYLDNTNTKELGESLSRSFQILSRMIEAKH